MEKLIKADEKIIIGAMPESFRKLYESGATITVRILREKTLKRYGQEMTMRIWRGTIVDTDLDEFERAENIARNIISYFLYGERSPIYCRRYTGVWKDYVGADYGIRFSL